MQVDIESHAREHSKLEEQVTDLAASYDKLAKSYGVGSARPTRTSSYS